MSKDHLNDVLQNPKRLASLLRRYWPKVAKEGIDECWMWVAKARHPYGYGRMSAGKGKYLKAHQIAWAIEKGPIPEGMSVLHSCDNPPCCNPAHLFLGSQQENMADAKAKGRTSPPPHSYGEAHHNSKLNEDTVRAIRADKRPNNTAIGRDYGIRSITVRRIKNREAWGWLQ